MPTQKHASTNQLITTYIDQLASFGLTKDGGVTRLLYSPVWMQAQQMLFQLFEQKGLTPFFDDVGNLYGRAIGRVESEPVILTGSHIDTVDNGGKYDGAYGVIASLLAVTQLMNEFGQPKKTIDVVSLCEEEGSRFPLTFWGSGNITGIHKPFDAALIKDSSGITMKEAMEQTGFGLGRHQEALRNDLSCFVELHIEQGSVLENAKESLGIVKSIVGQRRYTITVTGESNHAGTTPMYQRKDAMDSTTALIQRLLNSAKKLDPHFVATIGKMSVFPNTPNVIPGEVRFTLDIRHHQSEVLDRFYESMEHFFSETRFNDGVGIAINQWANVAPVDMSDSLAENAYLLAQRTGYPTRYMYSGAGHDAQVFGAAIPTCLLFVPSINGISHSPLEYTNEEDLQIGVSALREVLYQLAY
ncbi:allantoate deiminase [Shouchella patagoniensis]|uniref:allantoate deiminase n=1 Tax=Shouchella patagoniensis TaxID=228576 RepID=UPI000995BB8D|nr:allantoate deiminase [Shouchella patagoniensis]